MKPETEHKLDEVFSKIIRIGESDENGIVKCFVCGKPIPISQSVCGHWRKRRHLATRYLKSNCHPLCLVCNGEDEKSTMNYDIAMLHAYSLEKLQEIIDLSNSEVHITEIEARELLTQFREELKSLTELV